MSGVWVGTGMAIALLLSACGPQAAERPVHAAERDKLIYANDQKALDAAIAQAKANLPVFWSKFDAAPSKKEFSVKVMVETPPHGSELIWMDVTGREGDAVSGVLINDPVKFQGRYGDRFTAKTTQIVDWSYPKNGRFYGHFTTRVLSSQVSAAERAEAERMMWPTALEPQ